MARTPRQIAITTQRFSTAHPGSAIRLEDLYQLPPAKYFDSPLPLRGAEQGALELRRRRRADLKKSGRLFVEFAGDELR